MGGITGIWNLDGEPVDRLEINRFNEMLSLRGPGGSGIFIDDYQSLALGHRRVSNSISVKQESQLLTYGDGRY